MNEVQTFVLEDNTSVGTFVQARALRAAYWSYVKYFLIHPGTSWKTSCA